MIQIGNLLFKIMNYVNVYSSVAKNSDLVKSFHIPKVNRELCFFVQDAAIIIFLINRSSDKSNDIEVVSVLW